MDKLNKSSMYQMIVIILMQTMLLLFMATWKEIDLFGISYDKLLNIVIFVVVGLSLLSLIVVKEIYKVIEYETEFKIQQIKLEENKRLIQTLRSQKHDFLNHLQTIYGMVQLNKQDKVKEYIKSLNNDLSEIKFTSDGLSNSILDSILIPKKLEAIKQGVSFTYKVERGVEDVDFPLDKLFRIVSNLVDNAIDAMEGFNGKKEIRLIGKNNGDNYHLSVYNIGPIIEEEIQHQIFEPGFSTKGDGRGFGLHIIKSLIEEREGKLELKSEAGFGTEFTCILKKK
jgi:hypothetical protein